MAGNRPVLPIAPDIGAAPLVADQPLVKPVRTTEKAGGGEEIERGGR